MCSILIVEDDHSNLLLFSKLLSMFGYDIHGAVNAQEAMESLEYIRPDVILMDVHLPGGVDGIMLMHQIKQDIRFAGIPIIAVTAKDIWGAGIRNAGFDGLFQKPVDVNRLRTELSAIMA